jgi:hypothetical protein
VRRHGHVPVLCLYSFVVLQKFFIWIVSFLFMNPRNTLCVCVCVCVCVNLLMLMYELLFYKTQKEKMFVSCPVHLIVGGVKVCHVCWLCLLFHTAEVFLSTLTDTFNKMNAITKLLSKR